MAMNYQNFASLGVNLNRQKYGPLDISNVFTSTADLKYYLTKGTFTEGVSEYWYKNANEKIVPYPYEGQVLATVIDGVVNVYTLALDAEGNFVTQEIAGKIEVDGTTIVKDAEGKLSIVAPVDPDSKKTYNFAYANGVYSWVEVDTATAAGQAQAIAGLTDRTVALETTINGKPADEAAGTEAVVGLVEKVAALEAVDNATQAELDAYKTEVETAIGEALQAAKNYADENDANTEYNDAELRGRIEAIEGDYLKEEDKYDDTELAARVKAIEDDYLTEADKYNDTVLAGRVTTAEEKINELDAAVKAIDYVDADELANAIKDFATDSELEAGLALKADKTALEALQNTVEAFLTGDGTEAALDSLKELVAYIESHDDVDIAGIMEDIEAIEGKLAGVESTVVAYVTAAIDALKIGDYAKAADLTALADRVAVLEAKPFDTYATKTEVQDVDAKFANYTTTEILTTQLAAKADANAVVANDTFETFKTDNATAISDAKNAAIAAAKTETEAQVGALKTEVAKDYATKAMLETHEGEIENELLAYAKTAEVNAELAKKIETGSIAHATEEIAEGVTVNGTQLAIVVDAFTKAETRQYVADTISQMTGGESAADVLLALNNYKSDNDERVGAIETKNGEQDTAIAAAQAKADKAEGDAAKVAGDLVTANAAIADNTREIGVAKSSIETVNTTLTEKITALEGKATTIEGNITALQTTVSGHTTTITEQGTKIAALENKDTELVALIQANTTKFNDYSTTAQMEAAIEAAVAGADLSSYAKVTDVEAIYKAGEGETPASGILAVEIERAKAAEQANADAISALVGDDKGKTIRGIAAEETAKIVANADEKYDTLKEIADFIISDTTGAAKMATDIAALQTTVGDAESGLVKAVADNAAAIAAIIQPKASTEISVAATGELSIKEVNINKLVQTEGDVLILNGGSALA